MIGIKLSGRLGNQLFQYAFAYSIAKKQKTSFFFDDTSQEFLLAEYFQVKVPLFNNILNGFKKVPRLANAFARIWKPAFKEIILNDNAEPATEMLKVKNWSIISGYFQSLAYFAPDTSVIKSLFSIKEKYKINTADYFLKDHASIVVHIRRGDYLTTSLEQNNAQALAIDKSYFVEAIKQLKALVTGNYKIYVVSDDMATVKAEFIGNDDEFIYLSNSTIVDFQLIQHADYLVLSNSSFSWWAGFLNTSAKKIIAPKYWCGFGDEKFFPHAIDYQLNWNWL